MAQKFDGVSDLEEYLSGILKAGTKIRSIQCCGNSYSEEDCEHLAKMITEREQSGEFTQVDFSDMFTSRVLENLCPALRHLVDAIAPLSITHLNMSHNAFGPNGVREFEGQFSSQFISMTHLNIMNCGLGPEGTETMAQAFIANGSIKLKQLLISRNRVEDKGAEALAEYFNTYDELEHLEIYQNGLEKDAFTALMPSLEGSAESGSLKHLDLNDNRCGDNKKAVKAICGLLGKCTQL